MHDEERPALEQAPEEDLDLEGAKTTVLSTPYGETTGVRRPPVLSAPTPDDAAGRAPAPAAASADDIVADVVALAAGEVSSRELTRAHLDRIAAVDGVLGAFLDVNAARALADADAADAARAAGRATSELTGVPVAVKDLIVTRGQVTTAASKILAGWVPPYDATLVTNLRAARLPILGKTNLDEFAMGGSTEHSAFGRTANPWDTGRIPGGSSW